MHGKTIPRVNGTLLSLNKSARFLPAGFRKAEAEGLTEASDRARGGSSYANVGLAIGKL